MKKSVTLLSLVAALGSLLIAIQPVLAQSTAFTYQGFLTDQGAPAHGIYDLRFTPTPAAEPSSPGRSTRATRG